jgi:RimJ/RimL family protein N-acetyltransferase
MNIHPVPLAEIGIMIGEKTLWDQGYGTESHGRMLSMVLKN